jgi:POT family proton-dependent oligopeptide transporter
MIGAILSDRYKGKYPVILWVSLLYCVGHGVLAFAGRFAEWEMYWEAEMGMYIGLSCIAVGAGGIKPCVSANVGDQFTAENSELVTQVFQIFYFIINFGSFFSTILTPLLYDWYGPEIAFGVPGVLMGIATFVFWLGRNKFVHVPPNPGGKLGLMDFVASTLLFSPVFAIIIAVFVVGGHYEPPASEGLSGGEFYAQYVSSYLGYIATHAWWYFVVAFALAGVGLFIFNARQKQQEDNGFLAVFFHSIKHRAERKEGQGFFDVARDKFGDEAAEGPPAVMRIALVFSMVSVFWALFDQHASTWIKQAGQMDLVVNLPYHTGYFAIVATIGLALYGGTWLFMYVSNRGIPKKVSYGVASAVAVGLVICVVMDTTTGRIWELELLKSQISALNPLMVMAIIPLLNVAVYKPMETRGREIRPLQKMTVGMFTAAAAFGWAAFLQMQIEAAAESGEQVHVLWQIGQYLIMTTAEVLVSVTGLEFAYTQAPRAMKSTIMGFWLLCVTFGNVLVAFLAPMEEILTLSDFFWLFTGLMVAAAILFMGLAYMYKGKTYLQEVAAAK